MEIVKNLTLLRLFKYILAVLLGTIILADGKNTRDIDN